MRIWALLGARAGDNDQVIALAEVVGLPFETKRLSYNWLQMLGPRLLGSSTASLSASARQTLQQPLPDLTISAGHRSVPIVRALRRRSGGRTRSIHVGFPRVSPDHFDLVIATPQYPIADHPKLLRIPYALTRAATAVAETSGEAEISALPAPRKLLIVGGPTLFWNLDERALTAALSSMLEEARQDGGGVMVTTSPRTPAAIARRISSILAASELPTILAQPRQEPRYASLLRTADSIRVTADSVSMISDAIWTGKPIALVPIAKSPLGRLAFRLNDAIRPETRLYPQDLRFFWKALAEIGISEQLAMPQVSSDREMRLIVDRSMSIIDTLS
ncbi:MAG TPA: ELM1/GtrOC1 family putative glycosyltransferase [Sphingomicrobium sp.]|nr:ELM1/GtrOC1 family putative glycosyltransferase [Sphingomicrobium sp.]